jgi:putative holliday junction resolvase
MTQKIVRLLGIDVGEKRIGLSLGDSVVKIAIPIGAIEVDGNELDSINKIIKRDMIDFIVIGYPRNQKGEVTAQTKYVEGFSKRLRGLFNKIVFQDESLTSVIAEERLISHNKSYKKSDIDSQAATIILQDYIEANYAK